MNRTPFLALLAAGLTLNLFGCHFCSRPDSPSPQPGPILFPGPGAGPAPPAKGAPWPSELPPPAPIGYESKSAIPYEMPKGPMAISGSVPSIRLYPPEVIEKPNTDSNPKISSPEATGPGKIPIPKIEERVQTQPPPALPIGIPQFTLVREKLANGLRPSLDDGLDWLQAQGYKSVLFIHAPGAPDSADHKQVEKRGMRFLALEVSPVTLTQEKIDEFNRIVGDSAVLPLYVYDNDGSAAGTLWYLNFRQTQQTTDEAARNLARPLGLRVDGQGAHRDFWEAAQRFVKDWPGT